MEYDGFISTIIERSEKLLPINANDDLLDANDDLQVTSMLILLNTGFALVWDRIIYWDDDDAKLRSDDAKLRSSNRWGGLKNKCKKLLKAPVNWRGEMIFERFRTCDDFTYFKIEKNGNSKKLSAHNIVRSLKGVEPKSNDSRTLDLIMRAMRNSFAHGGILPMSRSQAGVDRHHSSVLSRIPRENKIDRVYFVSTWFDEETRVVKGWIVMEFGLDALRFFWDDWKALLLLPGEKAMRELDKVA